MKIYREITGVAKEDVFFMVHYPEYFMKNSFFNNRIVVKN